MDEKICVTTTHPGLHISPFLLSSQYFIPLPLLLSIDRLLVTRRKNIHSLRASSFSSMNIGGGATHVPSAALSFVFPLLVCFLLLSSFIFARRALPLSPDCVAIRRNIFCAFFGFLSSDIIFTRVL